jgi:hypothetical protein
VEAGHVDLSIEALKSVIAALLAVVIPQLYRLMGVLIGLRTPRNVIEEGQKTIQLIDAWAQANEHLQHVDAGPLRESAQVEIDRFIPALHESMQHAIELREARMRLLSRTLGYLRPIFPIMRLNLPSGWLKGIAAFLFYASLAMVIQSVNLYENNSRFNPGAIVLFGVITLVFWLLSWPKKDSA